MNMVAEMNFAPEILHELHFSIHTIKLTYAIGIVA